LVSVIADGTELATPGEMAAIDAFNDRLRAQGYWVYANGLAEPHTATVIDARGEEPVFTDGPFLESKEFLAGYWIVEVDSAERAYEIAAKASCAPGPGGAPLILPIEVRQVMSGPPDEL